MCVAQPGRIVTLDAGEAVVETGGKTCRVAALLLPDLAVGDDVLVSGGLIIARLSPDEAAARRLLFDQVLDVLGNEIPTGDPEESGHVE